MATILCLDDEPAIGLILQDTLERAGHRDSLGATTFRRRSRRSRAGRST